jgi:sugar phosphate isomerase/epimerase
MKFGFPVYTGRDIKSSVRKARDCGFDYIELDVNPPRPQIIKKDELKTLRNLNDYGLEIAFHAPIFGIDISHYNDMISDASIGVIDDALNFARRFKPLYFNMHISMSSNPHLLTEEKYRKIVYAKAVRNFQKIKNSNKDIKIIVENNCNNPIFRTIEDFERLKGVDFCLDVGHTKVASQKLGNNQDASYWIRHFKDRIFAAHLHDCKVENGQIHDHNVIGSGCLDFDKIFNDLKKTRCEYVLLEEDDSDNANNSLKICRAGLI